MGQAISARTTELDVRKAEAEAEAKKAEAEAKKAQAEAEAKKAQAEAEARKAQAEAELEGKKVQAEAEVKKAQAELEGKKVQAEAELEGKKVQAEAELEGKKVQAELEGKKVQAELEGKKVQAEAEREATKLKGAQQRMLFRENAGIFSSTFPSSSPNSRGSSSKKARMDENTLEVSTSQLLPNEIQRKVSQLFMSGLSPTEIEDVGNQPTHHQVGEKQKYPVPNVYKVPGDHTPEPFVVYFLCALSAVLAGKELVVHDIQTRRHMSDAPDMAITMLEKGTELPRLAYTANFVFEVKTKEKFGTLQHVAQAEKYGIEICSRFGYSTSFVVLASQEKIRFMKVERFHQTSSVRLSDCFDLNWNQQSPSDGLLALYSFIAEAKQEMQAAELPQLILANGDTFPVTAEALELWVDKRSSRIYSYDKSKNSRALKWVDRRDIFEAELEAMKAISSHPNPNVASLVAFDLTRRYLLIDPLGDIDLRKFAIENWDAQMRKSKFEELLEGLKHVHTCGWLHRDVRPENIIVCSKTQKLVLIDFSLAVNGSEYRSNEFCGFIPFVAEAHLQRMINEAGDFYWDQRTDINALLLVVKYKESLVWAKELDRAFEKYIMNETAMYLEDLLKFRKRHYSEAKFTSLDAIYDRPYF